MTLFGLEIILLKAIGHKVGLAAAKKAAATTLAHSSTQVIGHTAMQYTAAVNASALSTGTAAGYVATVGHGAGFAAGVASKIVKERERLGITDEKLAAQIRGDEEVAGMLLGFR
jgi:hypothetical protein